jgi:hypothetical protein
MRELRNVLEYAYRPPYENLEHFRHRASGPLR